ncbi:MAG: luciferase [Halolamina sp.]
MLSESRDRRLSRAGIDMAALKPTECDVTDATALAVSAVTVDYEGRDHLPSAETLRQLATELTVYVTAPVRADGFDPLGDDALYDALPASVTPVLVAGHGAYLGDEEADRAIAPRLGAACERFPEAWVGTEGIERIALAAGGTQFELLSRSTARDLRALRAAGFEGEIAVYAPTVLTDDEDTILDAVGDYTARRRPVARALPDDAATDGDAAGRAREVLSKAVRDYALVGDAEAVAERVAAVKSAGADRVVGYPARGLTAWTG